MIFRCIQLTGDVITSFFCTAEWIPSYVRATLSLLIYCPESRLVLSLGYCKYCSKAHLHSSLWCADTESFSNIPRGGIAGPYGCLIFSFLRKLHTAFHGSCTSLRSYRHWARVQFLYIRICCMLSWWQPCWLPWVKSRKAALTDVLAAFLTVPTVWPPCQQDASMRSLNAWWPLGPPSLTSETDMHTLHGRNN